MAGDVAKAQLAGNDARAEAQLQRAKTYTPPLSATEWQRFEKIYTETFDAQRRLEAQAAGDRDSVERAVKRDSYILDEIRSLLS